MPQKFISKKRIIFATILLVSILLIFINPIGFFDPIRGIFFRFFVPLQKIAYLSSHKISVTLEFLGSISELKKENSELLRENNALAARVADLEGQKKENEDLREQLRLLPREKFDLQPAFVIGQDAQRLGSWIMIDKGSDDGLRQEMPVIAYEGILIGKVSELYSGSAKITLLSDSNSAVNVFDLETDARGVGKGEYGLGILMDMVSQKDALNVGDTILTSGLGSDMPKGLLIGQVQEVHTSEDRLFQRAVIIPRIKYSKLDTVFVIKN